MASILNQPLLYILEKRTQSKRLGPNISQYISQISKPTARLTPFCFGMYWMLIDIELI